MAVNPPAQKSDRGEDKAHDRYRGQECRGKEQIEHEAGYDGISGNASSATWVGQWGM
ncbi:MAG TPA: hypothetical protein VFC78_12630 [Tepidisphaeraceae bacterium]|nr:hypothetical protein [Tepidisphaeraceae bacterium]